MNKRYRWVAEHLLELRSFIKKTKRFDDGLLKIDADKAEADADSKAKQKANVVKQK